MTDPPDDGTLPEHAWINEHTTDPGDELGYRTDLPATDVGNAKRLQSISNANLHAVTGDGWIAWNGIRWARDNTEHTAARAHAHRTAEAILLEADVLRARNEDEKKVAGRYQHHLKSQSSPRLDAMLKEARTLLAIEQTQLDARPDLLNTPTATIDLRTGRPRPHDRDELHTKLTGVPYVADALAPRWHAFLQRSFDGNDRLITFLQRSIGYTLTGHTGEQVFFVMHGAGANGKSVFARAIQHALGDYAATAQSETFMVSRRAGGDTRSDLVRLQGARLVTTSETSEGLRFDDRLVKEITGGEQITARALYAAEVTFTPVLKLWVSCNALPRFDGADYAMRRRLRVIPFSVQIPKAEQDPRLTQRLLDEAPGILAWAIQGARDWYQHGLGDSPEVDEATDATADQMDPVGLFLSDECDVSNSARWTPAQDVAKRYGGWAEAQRQPQVSAKKLGDSLARHGLVRERVTVDGRHVRGWRGLALREGLL